MIPLSAGELQAKLAEAAKRLSAALSPEAIYPYGSHVYGTPDRHSDLDLLVILADSNEGPYTRDVRAYRALAGLGVPKDVQVYTCREFEQRAALRVSFDRTVKMKGKLVHVA